MGNINAYRISTQSAVMTLWSLSILSVRLSPHILSHTLSIHRINDRIINSKVLNVWVFKTSSYVSPGGTSVAIWH